MKDNAKPELRTPAVESYEEQELSPPIAVTSVGS